MTAPAAPPRCTGGSGRGRGASHLFCSGQRIQRIVPAPGAAGQQAGHEIALHSASHKYSDIYRSADAFWADIELLRQRLAPYVDAEELRCLRFPGGSTNTVSHKYGGSGIMQQLKEQAEQQGLRWVGLERLRRRFHRPEALGPTRSAAM